MLSLLRTRKISGSTLSRHLAIAPASRLASVIGDSSAFVRLIHHGPSRPSDRSSPWERKATQVKNTDVTNPYLELIRETHDPSMQLKTLEEELKGTIGKALGKQGEKILHALRRMQEGLRRYETTLQEHGNVAHHPMVVERAQQYNLIREEALKARWELLVHRQAVGLIVNNHKYVIQHYPIGEALPIPKDGDGDSAPESSLTDGPNNKSTLKKTTLEEKPKVFGDQLSWWQNIGRWR